MNIQIADDEIVNIPSGMVELMTYLKTAAGETPRCPSITRGQFDLIMSFGNYYLSKSKEEKTRLDEPEKWAADGPEIQWLNEFFANLDLLQTAFLANVVVGLGFETMIRLVTFRIAQQISGQSVENIRASLELPNDLTAGEVTEILRETSLDDV